jgi:hypothetical protein
LESNDEKKNPKHVNISKKLIIRKSFGKGGGGGRGSRGKTLLGGRPNPPSGKKGNLGGA